MVHKFPYLDEHDSFQFPPVESASEEGIVAAGGNLSPGMLLSAYRQGIFPWYSEDDPIIWWSPNPRFILYPDELHVSKSMRRSLRRRDFRVSLDTAFSRVIDACRTIPRPGQDGTWITDEVVEGYTKLHELGYAHSVEAWSGDSLAGGLYGIALGRVFFGESMFSNMPNASKTALIGLATWLRSHDFQLIDCQYYTSHLESLGARNCPRGRFIELLTEALRGETLKGKWTNRAPIGLES